MITISKTAIAELADLVESFFAAADQIPDAAAFSLYRLSTARFELYNFTTPEAQDELCTDTDLLPGFSIRAARFSEYRVPLASAITWHFAALSHFDAHPPDALFPDLADILLHYDARIVDIHVPTPTPQPVTTEVRLDMPLSGSLPQCLKWAQVLFDQHTYELLHVLFHIDAKQYRLYTTAEFNKAGLLNRLQNTRHTLCITRYELAHLLPAPAPTTEGTPGQSVPEATL